MTFLKTPFKLGNLVLPSNIWCAPLAGCSDFPFRKMLAKYRPGLFFCEMVKMDALIRHDPHTFRLLDYDIGQHPIGAQLCGSKPHIAGKSAKILEDLGFDVIDLNCGCPVDKVTKDGSGSGLLKTPELIGEILSNIVAAVKVPVTVKIRAGWDETTINAAEITKIAEEAGAKAITIHGRTRAQAYKGPANRDYIQACKEVAKSIHVIGNGDVFSAESAHHMFENTGCDGILVARGLFGRPWIIEDIYRYLQGLPLHKRSVLEHRDIFLEHFDYIIQYQPERRAVLDMRRVGCWFLKNIDGAKQLRMQLNRCKTIQEIKDMLGQFNWEDASFSSTPAVEEECEVSC